MADHLRWSRVTDEVAFPRICVAPLSFRIPMPGFAEQLGILAIADGLPARRLDFPDELRSHHLIGNASAQPVDARAQRAERAERTHRVRRRRIHDDVLRRRAALRDSSGREENCGAKTPNAASRGESPRGDHVSSSCSFRQKEQYKGNRTLAGVTLRAS